MGAFVAEGEVGLRRAGAEPDFFEVERGAATPLAGEAEGCGDAPISSGYGKTSR